MTKVLVSILVAAISLTFCVSTAEARDPRPNLTKGETIKPFVDAVTLACTYSKVSGVSIDALPSGVEDDLIAADALDRKYSVAPEDKPLMVSKTLGNLLEVFYDKNNDCIVSAVELPVQIALDTQARLFRTMGKDVYQEVPYKPGYMPVGYEFVRKLDDGGTLTVHMEGAEPGLPGHALRFSLIVVRVSRKP